VLQAARDEVGRFKKSCGACCPGQVKKMRTITDWWSLWIGLASFAIAIVLAFIVAYGISSQSGPGTSCRAR